jgi:hypothetical protein
VRGTQTHDNRNKISLTFQGKAPLMGHFVRYGKRQAAGRLVCVVVGLAGKGNENAGNASARHQAR